MTKSNSFFYIYTYSLRFLLILSICWIFFCTSSAQIKISVLNEITDELTTEKPNSTLNSEIELIQQGTSNQTEIIQNRSFQYALPNQGILKQDGFQNMMKINQNTSNGIIVAIQNGGNNNLDLKLDGENLKISTLQEGNNNKIKQTLTQSINVDLNLIQQGDNNNIEQTLNNKNGLNMTIIQRGQNAAIKVIQN